MGPQHTLGPKGTVDPETGQVRGVKIAACRNCGHIRQVSVATGLCGVLSCYKRRGRRKNR